MRETDRLDPPPPITAGEYERRREATLAALDGGVLILGQGRPRHYSRDVAHRFRPDSDFRWLTGFSEPEAVLVLREEAPRFTMFVLPRDPNRELWDGRRVGPEGARERYGADEAYPLDELPRRLPRLIDGARALAFRPWRDTDLDAVVAEALDALARGERSGKQAPTRFIDPAEILHELRLVKSAAEIEQIAHAARLSAAAQRAAMAACRPGRYEYELEAVVEHVFRSGGAAGPGYPTIVAAGANGCILHYVENSARIGEDDLVLLDAGCEFAGYNGDITRTFPAAGGFTPAQRDLYDAVHEALDRGLASVAVGRTVDEIHAAAAEVLADAVVSLGLAAGPAERLIADGELTRFFPHRTSHWLGADVHDVGRYRAGGAPRPLEEGMVLTVEPGLYVPEDDDLPEELRGQAVRLEDDVVVTRTGSRILTRDVPVDPDEVCTLVGSAAAP